MSDGTICEIVAAIRDKDGKAISAKKETFTRKVMPFETAPKAGTADLVPAPFTPPVIAGNCHLLRGTGLYSRLRRPSAKPGRRRAGNSCRPCHAENQDPAHGPAVALAGGRLTLKARGRGKAAYRQLFTGAGRDDGRQRATSTTTASTASPSSLPRGRTGGHRPVLLGIAAARGVRHAHGGPRGVDVEGLGKMHGLPRRRRRAVSGTPSAFPSPCASGRATCRRFAGSATTIAAFVSPARRTRACTTTMPCRPPR